VKEILLYCRTPKCKMSWLILGSLHILFVT
jgi:hypothetical protein